MTRTKPPLAEYRKAAGLSQQKLGEAVGVHQATVCFYESGRGTPHLALAIRIAAELGQPVETLWATLLPTTAPQHQPESGAPGRTEAHQDAPKNQPIPESIGDATGAESA